MLKWISKKLNLEDSASESEADIFAKDRIKHQQKKEKEEEVNAASTSKMTKKIPVDQQEPLYRGGLPDDFWTILVHIPYTFGSNDVEEIRKTPLYRELKAEYEAKLAYSRFENSGAVYTPRKEKLEESGYDGASQKNIGTTTSNTSTESSQQPQSSIKATSRRLL